MNARILAILMAAAFLGGATAALSAEQHPAGSGATGKHHTQKHKAHHHAKHRHAKHDKSAGK